MKAPDFRLPDENGTVHTLSQYKGLWVILYFYPKDDTPGCTKEACSFRDSFAELRKMNVIILGVSKDSVSSHKKFKEKYHLGFPLLSDPLKQTIQAYHAWGKKKFLGKEFEGTLRKTYLIDPSGDIRKVYDKVSPSDHAKELLRDITSFL